MPYSFSPRLVTKYQNCPSDWERDQSPFGACPALLTGSTYWRTDIKKDFLCPDGYARVLKSSHHDWRKYKEGEGTLYRIECGTACAPGQWMKYNDNDRDVQNCYECPEGRYSSTGAASCPACAH